MSLFKPKSSLPQLFVVTLPEQPWRQVNCRKSLVDAGLNISPIFIDGVYGPSINLRPVVPFRYDEAGDPHFMDPVSVGHVVSHRIAISVALASNHGEFIICDDTTRFGSDFTSQFEAFRSSLADDFNVAQLDITDQSALALEMVSPFAAKSAPFPFRASCLWWKRSAARTALSLLHPYDRPFDVMLIERVFPHLSHAIASPAIASPEV